MFGLAGSCNVINILDVSPLHSCFLHESDAKIYLDYLVGDYKIIKLFYLDADGIYPPPTQFIKTILIPLTKKEKKFAGGKRQPGRTSRELSVFSGASGICWHGGSYQASHHLANSVSIIHHSNLNLNPAQKELL